MSKGYRDYFPAFSKSSANVSGRSAFYAREGAMLADPIFTQATYAELLAACEKILAQQIHGLAFSPYLDGQEPGLEISSEQIAARLNLIAPYTHWVRTFSCTEGNQETPRIAHEAGLQTMVGVNIGKDLDKNRQEMANGIALAKEGHADILAIGNEVLLRGDIPEEMLCDYILQAKQALPEQVVSYVDAYFLFENHPRVTEVCDALLINCYPFWEETEAQYALYHMQDMYQRAVRVAGGKPVIISETGWPSDGSVYGQAMPGLENALAYFVGAYQWAAQEEIDIFYFSAFDELWKQGDEGDVGAYWGLWDTQGNFKFQQ